MCRATVTRGRPRVHAGDTKKRSLIFFEHVAAHTDAEFVERVTALGEAEATKDIAEQVHDVATGLSAKYRSLRHAAWSTLVALGAVLVLGICVMISTCIDWVK